MVLLLWPTNGFHNHIMEFTFLQKYQLVAVFSTSSHFIQEGGVQKREELSSGRQALSPQGYKTSFKYLRLYFNN